MTEPNPVFDALHPSGQLLFRSCRGGYLHSVVLTEEAMGADAQTLAAAIKLTADVSYLRALMEVRSEILSAGHTPTDEVPTQSELDAAEAALAAHELLDADG
ncbi:MAG: DUF2694 family protein [Mycobacterium sp.]